MGKLKQSRGTDSVLAEAVAHPLRARCLTVLDERTASPSELKDILDVPLGDAAYHVKRLLEMGLIELVDTRPVRGAVEHFYRSIRRPNLSDEEFASLSPRERLDFASYICKLAFADATTAIEEGTFCRRPDAHVSRVPLLVDEEGWDELRETYSELLQRVLDVQAASAERMSRDPEAGSIPTTALSMFFEMPERSARSERSLSV